MTEDQRHSEQVVAATFLLPASSAEPLVIELPHHALRLVVVTNGSVGLLDESWSAGGVYILLGPGVERERYSAYVGKAPSGLRARVKTHVRSKEGWDRALLVAHTSYGFSSAAVGWLEGRLWDVLRAAPAAELRNQVRPRDESLPPWERRELERYIAPITAVLRAVGANPDTPDQVPTRRRGRGPRRQYTETIADLLEAGMLTVGSRLHPVPEAYDTPADVVEGGHLMVDGSAFETPSAAGVHVMGRAVNGWDFWGAASGDGTLVPLAELRRRLRANGAPPPAPTDDVPGDVGADSGAVVAENKPSRRRAAAELPDAASPENADEQSAGRRRPRRVEGTLADIVAAGLMETSVIFTTYKGQRYEASQHGENGLVLADATSFNSLSLAAAHITGRPTNGWTFWKKTSRGGKTVALAKLRSELGESSSA